MRKPLLVLAWSGCLLAVAALGAGAPSPPEAAAGAVAAPFEMLRPDASWCGPRVLYFFSVYLGRERPLDEIVKLCNTDESGLTSLADLSRAAEELGLHPTPVRCSADDLAAYDGPALIGLSNRDSGPVHFVGVLRVEEGRFIVLDPSAGVRTQHVRSERIARSFTGHALLLGTGSAAQARWFGIPGMLTLATCWIVVAAAYLRPEWAALLARQCRWPRHEAKHAE